MFSMDQTKKSIGVSSAQMDRLKAAIDNADAIVIGAGAGLSASAGFTYSGERFNAYFHDFEEKYGFQCRRQGGRMLEEAEIRLLPDETTYAIDRDSTAALKALLAQSELQVFISKWYLAPFDPAHEGVSDDV